MGGVMRHLFVKLTVQPFRELLEMISFYDIINL